MDVVSLDENTRRKRQMICIPLLIAVNYRMSVTVLFLTLVKLRYSYAFSLHVII